jgi:hypothetical protein
MRTIRWLITPLLALALTTRVPAETILHVDAALTTGADNGSSWENAYRGAQGLQGALAAAAGGAQIWIAGGTYTPAPPNGNRDMSFIPTNGVALYGGFAGGETQLAQRDWLAHPAILSGDLNQNDGPKGAGTSENSRHVVRLLGVDATCVLDGLVIRGGVASGPNLVDDSGGNVVVIGGAPVIRNCTITAGDAGWSGGGMYLQNAFAEIADCRIIANTAQQLGGGVAHVDGGASQFKRCRFEANRGGGGSAFYNGPNHPLDTAPAGAPVITDCDFIENLGEIGGASGVGIMDMRGSPRVERCRFIHNVTQAGGGGMYLGRSNAEVRNCDFLENSAPGDGGGAIFLDGTLFDGQPPSGFARFVNCRFAGNNGGVVAHDAVGTFINCAFVENSVGITFLNWPAVFVGAGASLTFTNNIVWGNKRFFVDGLDGFFFGSGDVTIERSCVESWDGSRPGQDNFSADPQFVDADGPDNDPMTYADNDYRPGDCSPVLDIADASALPADVLLDRAGLPRFHDVPGQANVGVGATVYLDLGPDEVQGTTASCPNDCIGDPSGNRRIDADEMAGLDNCLLGPVQSAPPSCALTDWTGNGRVDLRDYAAFQQRLGELCP